MKQPAKEGEAKIRVNLRLTPQQHDELSQLAAHYEGNLSQAARAALTAGLQQLTSATAGTYP